jgi:response regulator RpfG family c-di-GMP phosphodiesterase
VLEGLQRTMHKHFSVLVSVGGEAALTRLDAGEQFEVIVSDMRMPGMNGAALLSKFRERAPDTVRLLLTGHAEIDAAIAAINEGHIFRFLTKPCAPDILLAALTSAVEQHRLITAEKVLLEQTLVGSVRALTEVLALMHAEAFGAAAQRHERARAIAERLKVPDPWHVEVASMLASVGYVVLPNEVLAKLNGGVTLDATEAKMVAQVPAVVERVLSHIPRLEKVRAVLQHQGGWLGTPGSGVGTDAALPVGARILRALHALIAAEAKAGDAARAIAALRAQGSAYDPAVLDALTDVCEVKVPEVRALALRFLKTGMVLAEDVKLESGMLIVARGNRITEHLLLRLNNFHARGLKQPILCEIPFELLAQLEAEAG